jgi:hypothetical protein
MLMVLRLRWITLQGNLCQIHPRSFRGFMAYIRVTIFSKPSSLLGGGT